MKYTAIRFLAAGLLFSGVSRIQAQSPEPSRILRVFREDIKSGKGSAHERAESSFARAFAKSGYPAYIGMDAMTGPTQAWFLERYDSYESMEKAIKISQAEPLKTTLSQLDAQDGELRSSERGMIAIYQKDMSYLPAPPLGAKARFYNITTIRVRPGHAEDFAEMRKLSNGAFAKTGTKRRFVVYSVSSGAPAGTYLILSAFDSLKALDPPPTPMTMREAFGADNQARYLKLQSDIVISTENALFAINPKMSNPPKEYLTTDADFWAPKPKPAAAKPATSPAGQQ
jgi:hypothetical protein